MGSKAGLPPRAEDSVRLVYPLVLKTVLISPRHEKSAMEPAK
jgi:hypothetical protein